MKIHDEFHATLLKIHPKLKEDIGRGIGNPRERNIALGFLEKVEGIVKQFKRIKFEFDVDDRVQVEGDILRMEVSVNEIKNR